MSPTISLLIKLNPSCCAFLTSKGRNISISFTYTRFSSKFPPLTEYCEESSLLDETPSIVFKRFSTPPVGPTAFFAQSVVILVTPSIRELSPFISIASRFSAIAFKVKSIFFFSPFFKVRLISCEA